MKHFLDMEIEELKNWLSDNKQPLFRTKQIMDWVYNKRAKSFADMANLPKQLRSDLANSLTLWTTKVVRHQQDGDGTEKLLLELNDGGQIECVLLREGIRCTICISSQVGCAMGCLFCASGLDGVDRNLTTGEYIEQMLQLQLLLSKEERLSHIVVMGMGEPLANLDNLLSALSLASSENGFGISTRKITISTVGLPKTINKLIERNSHYNLAISLHATDDQLRDKIVPANINVGIDKLLEAADQYFDATGRKLTYEYVLLAGINDHPKHAEKLAELLKHRNAVLNVIPYNPIKGLPYKTPGAEAIRKFRYILETAGINVQFRKRKGGKINAACGQLRRSVMEGLNLTH